MHHGLLMNSEVWVCITDAQRCLPFVLVERGFDVWFGNNRGNKYSKKSVKASSKSLDFWNFSIDEFAFHDIPNSIAYILETTGQPSLSYIGFSQGTAQAFASLAIHPKLNDQVNVFIALAPAMSPAGLSNGIVDALVKASPQVLYLLFGRRSILSSATLWQSILYPPLFVRVIDLGLSFLFGWRTENIATSQKLAAYPHLYSYTSTKSVVHWFQIIRTKSFQMYDDDVHPLLATHSKHTKVAKYPTRNIKTPVVLVYGGSDSLVDIKAMMRELPAQTVATEIPHYEHLDFLWARDVETQVFRHVFDALDSFTGAEHTKEEYARFRSARHTSLSASNSFQHHAHRASDAVDSDRATSSHSTATDTASSPTIRATTVSFRTPASQSDGSKNGKSTTNGNTNGQTNVNPTRTSDTLTIDSLHHFLRSRSAVELERRPQRSEDDLLLGNDAASGSQSATPPSSERTVLAGSSVSMPTADTTATTTATAAAAAAATDPLVPAAAVVTDDLPEVAYASMGTAPLPGVRRPALRTSSAQRLRNASSLSIDSMRGGKGGGGGIRIGSGKAVGGVTTEAALGSQGVASGASSSDEGRGQATLGRRVSSRGT